MAKRRSDILELLLVALLAGVAVWVIEEGRVQSRVEASTTPELMPLAARYGPDRNSEHGEEWIARDYFKDRRDGFFVDVGANDYKRSSNTYYLETALGWSGIAIEPQREFEAGYTSHRPKTR